MKALGALLEENKAKLHSMKTLAQEVQSMKLLTPTISNAPDIPMLQELIAQAIQTSDEFGNGSNEAKLAWENVEEVSASDNSVAMMPSLEEECLVEAVQGCEALEELGRVITLAKNDAGLSA